jgi:hypothetical protein
MSGAIQRFLAVFVNEMRGAGILQEGLSDHSSVGEERSL